MTNTSYNYPRHKHLKTVWSWTLRMQGSEHKQWTMYDVWSIWGCTNVLSVY